MELTETLMGFCFIFSMAINFSLMIFLSFLKKEELGNSWRLIVILVIISGTLSNLANILSMFKLFE